MILFGARRFKRIVLVCIVMLTGALASSLLSGWWLAEKQPIYQQEKSVLSDLMREKNELMYLQRAHRRYGRDYEQLPRYDQEHRSSILKTVREGFSSLRLDSLQYQFLPTGSIEIPDNKAVLKNTISVESLIILTHMRHMEDFYAFIAFIGKHSRFVEIRACDIKRLDSTKPKRIKTAAKVVAELEIKCLLSWYSLRRKNQ